MRFIGIIGQTGAGKSTVCVALAARGFFVLDGDRLAHEVTAPGSSVLAELAKAFGQDILELPASGNGHDCLPALNRRVLARRAFASPEATARLNAIIHPAIAALAHTKLAVPDSQIAFLEGATLLESPLANECAAFIAVTAPEDLRLARLLARDKLSAEDILLRMSAQRSEVEYCEKADFVIVNDGVQAIEPQVEQMLTALAIL
ncbi:MAG: dephospho-CoA kinase [Oscillospiraceae bacterium]|nr:dephospho-CoA kinase [Oscillospiraceae bacterium]